MYCCLVIRLVNFVWVASVIIVATQCEVADSGIQHI